MSKEAANEKFLSTLQSRVSELTTFIPKGNMAGSLCMNTNCAQYLPEFENDSLEDGVEQFCENCGDEIHPLVQGAFVNNKNLRWILDAAQFIVDFQNHCERNSNGQD